jgi:hypothetical protein
VQKFGGRIVGSQKFEPITDPRDCEHKNAALLSAINRDYNDSTRTVPITRYRRTWWSEGIELEPKSPDTGPGGTTGPR